MAWFGQQVAKIVQPAADKTRVERGSLFAPRELRSSMARLEGSVSFALYTVGFVIMIAGLIYGATLVHMPTHWIVVGTIVLLGLGIVKAVTATRQRDPSS